MAGYCFYTPDAESLINKANLRTTIESFCEREKKQTYVVCKPLSKDDAKYDYENAVAIFTSGMKPCFVDLGGDEDKFEEYIEDFKEDISFLAEKFKYRDKIGRKKHWDNLFLEANSKDFNFENLKIGAKDGRVADLITSLIVGSINDVSKIDLDAQDVLSSVKSKILLFDTDQTSFVFRTGPGKKYVIQGLAGSGKTELLLHKLKEIYSGEGNDRIAFTCHNKILASSMRSRIPEFFDFMRVEKQIEWNKKLFCFHSWGSGRDPLSGLYRYICYYYNLTFYSLSAGSFDEVCAKSLAELKNKGGEIKECFDYIFIDESQDFGDSFIELCELVTAKKIFIAGDVFQNIFRPIDDEVVNRADMVLKKCYRTDPKNLMFSHALGMGLYEKPVLRWLKDAEWEACGYNYSDDGVLATLSRDPLRRFEDIPNDFKSTSLHVLEDSEQSYERIISIIQSLREKHPNIEQGDIAVIYLDSSNYIYDSISRLSHSINSNFGWSVNVSYETKIRDNDKLFISNINNAKGLEFPFVICFAKKLQQHPSFRNALYTMMARSFLESHLVLSKDADNDVINEITKGLDFLMENNFMKVPVPSEQEIADLKDFIVLDEAISIEDFVKDYCSQRNASPRLVAKLISRISSIVGDTDYDLDYLEKLLPIEYERHKVL
ncbi:DEAD/DEAH box helicase [Providencia sp. PROV221]|uniref:DEAD/DEAH box helicase n=1 Tax=Providencia sp. PROV221 TaxID=2949916 RepID=UPI00234BF4EF|nr:ATP-binding domain-containing protein [Providencia sp. PROV221]